MKVINVYGDIKNKIPKSSLITIDKLMNREEFYMYSENAWLSIERRNQLFYLPNTFVKYLIWEDVNNQIGGVRYED